MKSEFAVLVSILGTFLLATGACLVIGRRRIARNIRAARASPATERGIALLGSFQVVLGVSSIASVLVLGGGDAFQHHSQAIHRLIEGAGLSNEIGCITVTLVGLGAIAFGVGRFVSFGRSVRGRAAEDDVQLSFEEVRRVSVATVFCGIGVVAAASGVFVLLAA